MSDTTDHDLLVELRTEFKGMRADIKDIKDNTSARLAALEGDHVTTKEFADHEKRLRSIEEKKLPALNMRMAYWSGGIAVIILALELYSHLHH